MGSGHVYKQYTFPMLRTEQALNTSFLSGLIKAISQGTILSNNKIYVHTAYVQYLIGIEDN